MKEVEDRKVLKKKVPVGSGVSCQVQEHRPFGFFISIPNVPFKGLVKIIHVKANGNVTPEDYPAIGTTIKAVILTSVLDKEREGR